MRLASLRNGSHAAVIRGGKAAADVEQFQIVAALFCFFKDARRKVQGLHVVFEVGGLAADVETKSLDDQAGAMGGFDQLDGLARGGPELRRQFDHGPGVGHADPQAPVRHAGRTCGSSRSPRNCRKSPAVCKDRAR